MTRCTKLCAAFLGLVLSLLLLCSCQRASAPLILPETNGTSPSQWKAQLIAALNEQQRSFELSEPYIQDTDTNAEAVLHYIQQQTNSGSAKVTELLSEGPDGFVSCAPALEELLHPSDDETCSVSYAPLPADALTSQNTDLTDTARTLIRNQKLITYSDTFSPKNCEKVSLAAGNIGGQLYVLVVFSS